MDSERASGVLFQATLEWDVRIKLAELPPDTYTKLATSLPAGRLDPDQSKLSKFGGIGSWICDMDEAMIWDQAGIPLSISKIRGVVYPVHPGDAVRDALRAGGSGPTFINVSVSNVGLYDVKSVHVEEDCCTERFQKFLDLGWRLLAVCPPNDARRPTYIIGHAIESATVKAWP
jgi:hypothetical protein